VQRKKVRANVGTFHGLESLSLIYVTTGNMNEAIMRSEIHQYIDKADERFLSLVYGMIQADQNEDDYQLSENEIKMLEERLADYHKNPESGSSWEEVRKRLMK